MAVAVVTDGGVLPHWGRTEAVAVVTVGVVEMKLYQYLQLVQ